MTGKQILEQLATEMDSDGLLDSEVHLIDLLDYLAIIGVDGAADAYQVNILHMKSKERRCVLPYDKDELAIRGMIDEAIGEEWKKMKTYFDAAIADAIRQQAWLKLSFSWQDDHEKLRKAEEALCQ